MTLTSISPPTEGVRHKQSETSAFVGENEFGLGTLYISESFLIWISNDGRGFSLPYPSISMHAISRDTRNFSHPCIYIILDSPDEKIGSHETNVNVRCFADKMAACSLKTDSTTAAKSDVGATGTSESGDHNGSTRDGSGDEGDDENGEQSTTVEVRFVPADVESLEPMYQALSDCQTLHPDENESFSEDEDEYGNAPQFGGASEEFQFDDHGQLVLSRMRGVRTEDAAMEHDVQPGHGQDDEEMEMEQFEDAE